MRIFILIFFFFFQNYVNASVKSNIVNNLKLTENLKFNLIMLVMFRIFDITKPFPVSYYDKKFKNSFGVIMDDVCAGLYVVVLLVAYMVLS